MKKRMSGAGDAGTLDTYSVPLSYTGVGGGGDKDKQTDNVHHLFYWSCYCKNKKEKHLGVKLLYISSCLVVLRLKILFKNLD